MELRITRAAGALLIGGLLGAAGTASAQIEESRPVAVEQAKPQEAPLPTLQFLRQNRDFLRGRMNAIVQLPTETGSEALPMDERMLRFREMQESMAAARDTLSAVRRNEEQGVFQSGVDELAGLEGQLDLLDSLLTDQEGRIRALEEDFLGHQETELIVVLRGVPPEAMLSGVYFADEAGETMRSPITADDRASLDGGGILEIYHELVEPRETTWELSVVTGDGQISDPVYLRLAPERNRLNFLELDMTGISREGDAEGVRARTWVQRTVSLRPEQERSTVQ